MKHRIYAALSIMYVNNEIGSVQDIEEIAKNKIKNG